MGLRWKLTDFLSQDDPVITLIAGAGMTIEAEEVDAQGIEVTLTAGSAGNLIATFSKAGALTVGSGTGRFLMPSAGTIVKVEAAINTAPLGADLLIDVNKNGTTIFTTQADRPVIHDGQNRSAPPTSPDVAGFLDQDYFTVDIDQVGSVTSGADLVVNITYILVADD